MITAIDHVGIAVKDFDATVRNYETIFGIAANWQGGTNAWKQAWFQFGNAALDVVAADGDSAGANAIRAEIDKFGEGISGLGFSVPDREEAVRLFERRGLAFVAPHETLSRDAEGRERRWKIAMMRRASGNGVALFLVENAAGAERWPMAEALFGDASVHALDHVVVRTANAERAVALYGGRLGLDLRLDRVNAQWGARQLFFRTGGAIVEIGASVTTPVSDAKDSFGGLAWRVKDLEASRARIAAAGIDVSEVRKGRKPGTAVFTVRSGTGGVPTLMLSGND